MAKEKQGYGSHSVMAIKALLRNFQLSLGHLLLLPLLRAWVDAGAVRAESLTDVMQLIFFSLMLLYMSVSTSFQIQVPTPVFLFFSKPKKVPFMLRFIRYNSVSGFCGCTCF